MQQKTLPIGSIVIHTMMDTQLIYAFQINTLNPYLVPVQSYCTQVNMTRVLESETLENQLVSRDAICYPFCLTLCVHTYPIIKLIVSSHYGLSAHSFLHNLLKQSEAIKFVSDWKHKGREPGGRIYKREFTRSIYFGAEHIPRSAMCDQTHARCPTALHLC